MAEVQAYLVWPLGKVKCFDMLYPSLEWNVSLSGMCDAVTQ